MIAIDSSHLLMIEPKGAPSAAPVIDELTCRMAGALVAAVRGTPGRPGDRYRGTHDCTGSGCRAGSDDQDHVVTSMFEPWEFTTNSLAVHYLAFHRDEITPEELAKVRSLRSLAALPQQPTEAQLSGALSLGAQLRDIAQLPPPDREPVRRVMLSHGAQPREGGAQITCDAPAEIAAEIASALSALGYEAAAGVRGCWVNLWHTAPGPRAD